LDKIEYRAYLGILINSAAFKSGNDDISTMFSTDAKGRVVSSTVLEHGSKV